MSALRETRRRIRSVESTRQVTRALELIAASRLKRTEARMRESRRYAEEAALLLRRIQGQEPGFDHPLYQAKGRGVLTIVVSADRGLSGPYGPAVLQALAREVRGRKGSVICLGARAAHYVARVATLTPVAVYEVEGADPVALAEAVFRQMTEAFRGGLASVRLISTTYHSITRHEVRVRQLLPAAVVSDPAPALLYEGGFQTLLDEATGQTLRAELVQAITESMTALEASRMTSMLQATNNATELIEDLRLAYNEERQALITSELAEITAGTEAQRG